MTTKWRFDVETPANGKVGKSVIKAMEGDSLRFTDKADLVDARERRKAAERLAKRTKLKPDQVEGLLEQGVADGLAKRAEEQQAQRQAEAAPPPPGPGEEDPEAEGLRLLAETPADIRAEADAMLRDPDLLDLATGDVGLLGVAGEKQVVAALYLVYTSRKLPRPVAARLRGPTASGKSYLIDRVAELMPPEGVIHATQMTPQALFHTQPGSLRHKLIVAGERSRDQRDEAAEATRALREMISAGRLAELMPVRAGDQIETVLVEQEGPIAFVESTTLGEVFAEDENRALPLYTDERPGQTREVITRVASEAAGLRPSGRDPERVRLIHHTAQRLLARCEVVIPFAPALGKALDEDRVEMRRAFPMVLSMIQASALLYQFQRQRTDAGEVVATRDDYRWAALLLAEPLRRLLGTGISAPAQRFLERLREWFADRTFTTAEARAKETMSRRSVEVWLRELRAAGLVDRIAEARGKTAATYQMAGQAAAALPGVLPTIEQLFDQG